MPRFILFLACGVSLPLAVAAGPPQLVRDINTQPEAVGSAPADFHDQGAWLFFTAFDGVSRTPWATDGTATGTVRLANTAMSAPPTWPALPLPSPAVRAGNLTCFFAEGVPWVSDGTPSGTRRLRQDLADAAPVGALNDLCIFTLGQDPQAREVWSTNGTDAVRLATINPGFPTFTLKHAIVGNRLYFLASGLTGTEPWVSDGTVAGTYQLDLPPQNWSDQGNGISNVAVVGNYVLFMATTEDFGRELWRIDTANNDAVSLVADIAPGTLNGTYTAWIDSVGGAAVFTAAADELNEGLWRSDGTAAGTAPIAADLLPGEWLPDDPYVGPTTNGWLFFKAGAGPALWSTNGTTVTQVVATGIDFAGVGVVGAHYYYAVSTPTGAELWRTDGTFGGEERLTGVPAGRFATYEVAEVAGDMTSLYVRAVYRSDTDEETAVRVVKYNLATHSAVDLAVYAGRVDDEYEPQLFGAARGTLYFDGRSGVGRELWSSNGTPVGTQLLKNIAPETGNASSEPGAFIAYGDRLYFAADDGINGRELWRSDATTAGTTLVQDLHRGPGSSEPQDAFVVGSRLLFFARDGVGHESYRLWATDGTATGSQPLTPPLIPPTLAQPVPPGPGSFPQPCGAVAVNIGPYAYFRANNDGPWELWRTDGTPAGTERVANFVSPPCWLTVFDGRVYFGADGGDGSGTELWLYDPAIGVASRVADLWPGAQGSNPSEITVLNDRLLFHAYAAANAAQLWRSDGTSAGTSTLTSFASSSFIRGITRAGTRVVFGAGPGELWASDGTIQGTARVGSTGFGFGYGGWGGFGGTLSISNRVLFLGAPVSYAPWVTDGTLSGTYRLRDLNAAAYPEPVVFVDFNGVAVFSASDGIDHRLWRSDGTPAGTTLIGGSNLMLFMEPPPTRLAAGQTFFYVSSEGSVGTELFAFSNEAPLAFSDSATADSAAAVTIAVLANDRDADGALDASSVRVFSSPANGTAVVQVSGAITYTSNDGFSGTDNFSYTVADTQRAVSYPAVVEVDVTAPPPPTPPPTTTPPATTPPPAPVPPASGGGGGGGAFGWGGALMLLAVLAHRRRRRAHR
jgi:ELWxxDGT repeat protein